MANYLLPVAVLMLLAAFFGILAATGLPRVRYARRLAILAWPPRIRKVESYPASITYQGPPGIHHVIKKKVFFGKISMPRRGYLGDSRIISAEVRQKWLSESERGLVNLNALVRDRMTQYPILVFAEDTATKYLDRDFFEGAGRNGIAEFRDAFIERIHPEDLTRANLSPSLLRESLRNLAPIGRRSLFVEAQLVSGGIDVFERGVQRKELVQDGITFQWALAFNKSGSHELQLIMKAISQSNGTEEEFEIYRSPIHTIKVFRIDGLTQRQVFLGSLIMGVCSLLWILTQITLRIREAL